MQKRELWKVIIYGIITLGIYDLVWLYKTRNEMVRKGADIPKFSLLMWPLIIFVGLIIFFLFVGAATKGSSTSDSGTSALAALSMLLAMLVALAWIPLSLWWSYKYCKGVERVTKGKLALGLNYVLLLVLSFIGVGFLWPAVVQDSFNKV